jgi:hypothetical protein
MKKIPIRVLENETRKTFRCNIIEGVHSWQCIFYQEYFQFKFINEDTLENCMLSLAIYLEKFNDISIFAEDESDAIYIAILCSHIRLIRSEKLMNRKNHG